MVTKAELKKLFPKAKATLVDAVVNNWKEAESVGITTPRRIKQFLANIGAETGGLSSVSESLNYTVDGLLKTFGRHRISEADARKYGRLGKRAADQEAIGNIIYGGDWGKKNLGNTKPGDGFKYRGAGMLQTTGRGNFTTLGFGDNPEALRDPATAFKTACREWARRGCNALADAGKTNEVRKSINGGTNGLEEVKAYLVAANKIWPDNVSAVVAVNIYDGKPHDVVKNVQTRLDDLGYFEIGDLDGRYGPRTAGAITTFQNDNGLPLSTAIDDKLLAALMAAGPRPISDKRASTTVADLRKEDVPEIKATDQTKTASYVGLGLAGFTGASEMLDAVKGSSEKLRAIWDFLEPMQAFVKDNLWLIMAAGAGFVIWKSGILQKIRVDKHREGSDLSI